MGIFFNFKNSVYLYIFYTEDLGPSNIIIITYMPNLTINAVISENKLVSLITIWWQKQFKIFLKFFLPGEYILLRIYIIITWKMFSV